MRLRVLVKHTRRQTCASDVKGERLLTCPKRASTRWISSFSMLPANTRMEETRGNQGIKECPEGAKRLSRVLSLLKMRANGRAFSIRRLSTRIARFLRETRLREHVSWRKSQFKFFVLRSLSRKNLQNFSDPPWTPNALSRLLALDDSWHSKSRVTRKDINS